MSEAENVPVATALPTIAVAFAGQLLLEPVEAGDWIVHGGTFGAYATTADGVTHAIQIPEGFRTDLASVPRFLPLAYAMFGGRGRKAAVLHDYLCRQGFDRAFADDVFWGALVIEEGPVVADAMYVAVAAATEITT